MMSVEMNEAADAILLAAQQEASLDELSDVDIDVDGDGSSSLSEIEYRDSHQDEEAEVSDDPSNGSDAENDSEAETERLEPSPNKYRSHRDVVVSSRNDGQIYELTPGNFNAQILEDGHVEGDDAQSDDYISLRDSPKGSLDGHAVESKIPALTLADSTGDGKRTLSAADIDTRKRKRSIMAGSGLDDDAEEPLRKRTGSIMTPVDDYAIEDADLPDEEGDTSNTLSGNISVEEGAGQEDGVLDEVDEAMAAEEEGPETLDISTSPKKRGRKKKKAAENGTNSQDEDPEGFPESNATINGDVDNAENEEEETEAALKNEEELERKRLALEQLAEIERQFATFRERLYNEGIEQLNREEAMLRQEKPTHHDHLAMVQCIDARRNERIRISEKLREFELQTLRNYAVARRSQIIVQYQQDVRAIRETKLEQLGKQWYEIQHDRRSYAGSVPDFTLRFPTRRSQQVMNQVAYSNEVSILSGVAKYVGFPAAPPMAAATNAELEEDFRKMGRIKHLSVSQPVGLPFQELAALRMAGSTTRFKPAEEQFIEQTPWANPQHPSHAHLLQRQTSAQQTPRTTSPFSQAQQPRRDSHQPGSGGPPSGAVSESAIGLSSGMSLGTRPPAPRNPLPTSTQPQTVALSPIGAHQPSLSPQTGRPQPSVVDDGPKHSVAQYSSPPPGSGILDKSREFARDVRREQVLTSTFRF